MENIGTENMNISYKKHNRRFEESMIENEVDEWVEEVLNYNRGRDQPKSHKLLAFLTQNYLKDHPEDLQEIVNILDCPFHDHELKL